MTYQRNDTPEPLAVGIRILFPDDIALLARAAQAAGYIEFTCRDGIGPRARAESGVGGPWNPLDDNGDAFTLAIALGIYFMVVTEQGFVSARVRNGVRTAWVEPIGDDVNAAVRRAIVRAAAALSPKL